MKGQRVTVEQQLHSDQGTQYTSAEYHALTKQYGITPSMSRRSNPYDNAIVENFFSMLKTECIYPYKPQSIVQARILIDDYIHFFCHERMNLK